MTSTPNPITNIPVLTEVISLESTVAPGHAPARPAQTPAAAAPVATAPAAAAAGAPTTPQPAPVAATNPTLSAKDLEQLEKKLTENVLRQLQTRIDYVLELKVRDGLADVLQTSIEDLARDIRTGLTVSLTELIRRTVSQELAKVQSNPPNKSQ